MSKAAVTLFAVVALVAAMPATADAALKLRLTDDAGNTTTVTGVGGVVAFAGPLGIGEWVINFTSGTSKPVGGTPTSPEMFLNSLDVSSDLLGTGGTLTIEMTDTGFVGPEAGFEMAIGGDTQGTVSYSAYYDTGDGEFVQGALIGTLGPFGPAGATPLSFSGTTTGSGPLAAGSYSITQVVTITHGAGVNKTGFTASVVPEPAAMALLGLGLAAVGAARRRRRAV